MLQIFVYIFSIYLCIFVCDNICGAIVLKPRFKIDVVVVVIWSIVIIINSVLTLQVSTASLPHDCEPCEIKVVSNHTCSLHTCVCAGSHRVLVRLSGLINGRNQFNSWGSPQVPHSSPGLCRTERHDIITSCKPKCRGLTSVADPGCFLWIPDPTFFHPGSQIQIYPSWIWIPDPHLEFTYFNPKNGFWALGNMIRVVHSGSLILILTFCPSWIPDPGVKKAPDPGSRIPDPDPQHRR